MIKRFVFATGILFIVAIIMATSPFNTAVVAQTRQINSPSLGTNSSSNPLPLKTIFKQVEQKENIRELKEQGYTIVSHKDLIKSIYTIISIFVAVK